MVRGMFSMIFIQKTMKIDGSGHDFHDIPLRHGFHPPAMDFMLQAWISCSRHGFHPPGMDFMLQTWISSSRRGFHAPGMDFILQAWIACSRHGFHPPGMDFILQAWISSLRHGSRIAQRSCSQATPMHGRQFPRANKRKKQK